MVEAPTYVLVYGPPGIGKLTIATELSRLAGATLFENDMSIDWALSIFPGPRVAEAGEPFRRLRDALRESVLSEIARAGRSVVMTFVYSGAADVERVERMFQAIEQHGGRVFPVQLTCEQAEHERRVQSHGRADVGKMTSPERLRTVMAADNLTAPIRSREGMTVDTSGREPKDVAEAILSACGLEAIGG